jgi:hypothetical protein
MNMEMIRDFKKKLFMDMEIFRDFKNIIYGYGNIKETQ